jgi:hypothetical protein
MRDDFVSTFDDIGLSTDASTRTGYGAVFQGEYFHGAWPEEASDLHINQLELLTVLLAAEKWGHRWKGLNLVCLCDNQASVAVINAGSSRDAGMMVVARRLHYLAALHGFNIRSSYINTKLNIMPDALSREDVPTCVAHMRSHFPQWSPQCVSHPDTILDTVNKMVRADRALAKYLS